MRHFNHSIIRLFKYIFNSRVLFWLLCHFQIADNTFWIILRITSGPSFFPDSLFHFSMSYRMQHRAPREARQMLVSRTLLSPELRAKINLSSLQPTHLQVFCYCNKKQTQATEWEYKCSNLIISNLRSRVIWTTKWRTVTSHWWLRIRLNLKF